MGENKLDVGKWGSRATAAESLSGHQSWWSWQALEGFMYLNQLTSPLGALISSSVKWGLVVVTPAGSQLWAVESGLLLTLWAPSSVSWAHNTCFLFGG